MRSSADGLGFEEFFEDAEPRLRRALVSRYGFHDGRDATAIGLAWGYENWERVRAMSNPVGYLYRVACSRVRPKREAGLFDVPQELREDFEPGLVPALAALSAKQRVAVVLTIAFGWTLAEVAEVTSSSISTVNTHRRRGIAKLRDALGVELT